MGIRSSINPVIEQYLREHLGTDAGLTLLYKTDNGIVLKVDDKTGGYVLKVTYLFPEKPSKSSIPPSDVSTDAIPMLRDKALVGAVMRNYDYSVYSAQENLGFDLALTKLPFYPGENYRAVIENKAITPFERFFCALEWLYAVRHLHDLGVAHLDLKPENILCVDQQHAVLIDFDTAHYLGSAQSVTIKPPRLGTPPYNAPESIHAHEYSLQSDLYALAVMLGCDLELLPGLKVSRPNSQKFTIQALSPEAEGQLSPHQAVIYAGMDTNPLMRPTLERLIEAVMGMVKAQLSPKDYERLKQHQKKHQDVLTIQRLYAEQKKKKGPLQRFGLDIRMDHTLKEKCALLWEHAQHVSGSRFFKSNTRTRDLLQQVGWLDPQGRRTADAPLEVESPTIQVAS